MTDGKHDNVVPRWMGGLTKREYFAAMAMQGIVSRSEAAANAKAIRARAVEISGNSGDEGK